MGRKLEISREAILDLEEIWAFIAGDNLSAADRLIDQLHLKMQEVAKLDPIGSKREELFPGMESLAYKN